MKAIILQDEHIEKVMKKLDEIEEKISSNQYKKHTFIDNAEFLELMKISKRTAQTWRDEGKISFSQIGSKIYYQISDIDIFMKKHYNKSFKYNRK